MSSHLLAAAREALCLLRDAALPRYAGRLAGALLLGMGMMSSSTTAMAEDRDDDEDWISAFERRASETQGKQPGWSVPLLAPHAGLIQSFRQDFTRPVNTVGVTTWNYGGGKGFNFIPLPNTQVDINTPAYLQRSNGLNEGAGDFSIGVKYRLVTANEKHGNYSAMVGMAAAFPTGSYNNGSSHTLLTPNVAVGKGWGRLDVQSSASVVLPVGNTATIGRHVTWNTLAQYHIGRIFWPEVESSTVFYRGGANDGRVQNHVLPGIMVGKIRLRPEDPKSRLGLAFGAGMQFATTHFHTFDHAPVFSVRLAF